jgi:hypothetical protein
MKDGGMMPKYRSPILELVRKYPTLFRQHWSYPTVNDGWLPLIDELCQKLLYLDPPADFEIRQCKEKFGMLRVYTCGGSDLTSDVISEYEERSATICEKCGAVGELRKDRSWWLTLCDKCNEV